jgi:hypothetical protein
VEGVLEELDALNEYFHDPVAGVIYFAPNSSDATGPSGAPPSTLNVPFLHTFFNLFGGQEAPVRNVSFSGLTFTGGRPTFMEPRGQPSGGDWALERLGALLFEGTEDVAVSDCLFTRIDGNAVFLSGYNRRAVVARNEFVWLGQNAVASWGRTSEWDGTGGQQPRHTLLFGNFVHEIGNYQKQSSFYFQAATCENTCVPKRGLGQARGPSFHLTPPALPPPPLVLPTTLCSTFPALQLILKTGSAAGTSLSTICCTIRAARARTMGRCVRPGAIDARTTVVLTPFSLSLSHRSSILGTGCHL